MFYIIIQTLTWQVIIPQLQHQAGDILVLAFSCLVTHCLVTRCLYGNSFLSFILKTSLLFFASLVFFPSWMTILSENLLSSKNFTSVKDRKFVYQFLLNWNFFLFLYSFLKLLPAKLLWCYNSKIMSSKCFCVSHVTWFK